MEQLIAGTARDVRYREELQSHYSSNSNGFGGSTTVTATQVLTFRIVLGDGGLIPVQLKGRAIEGDLTEGDQVEVWGKLRPGKVMKAKRVENLTTGIPVESKGVPLWAKIVMTPFVIAILGFIAWCFYQVFVASGQF
jgi:hypothetical protein